MHSVNQTNNETVVHAAYSLCESFPDEHAARKYPLANVYQAVKTTSLPSLSAKTTISERNSTENDLTKSPSSKAGILDSKIHELAFMFLPILLFSMFE